MSRSHRRRSDPSTSEVGTFEPAFLAPTGAERAPQRCVDRAGQPLREVETGDLAVRRLATRPASLQNV